MNRSSDKKGLYFNVFDVKAMTPKKFIESSINHSSNLL
jgi:hypothetical protein